MVIVGRGDLVCAAGYSWHEDVCFSRADQPLATEAAAADAAAAAVIRNRVVMFNMAELSCRYHFDVRYSLIAGI